jgi:DNA-binding response OmpR family regulator
MKSACINSIIPSPMEPNKIIIQDSNLTTANTLRVLLSQAGYSVITIKTLKTLHSLIEKFQPHLLIIEYNKDDKHSKRILTELKEKFNIKVIATTCNGNRLYLKDNIGFDDCLSKPFLIEDIQQVIKKQLAA